MPSSALTLAQRKFVSVLLSVAAAYGVAVRANRDSEAGELLKAYRSVARKAHPDKGGSTRRFQALQAAKEAWDAARKHSSSAGGRPAGAALATDRLALGSWWREKGGEGKRTWMPPAHFSAEGPAGG